MRYLGAVIALGGCGSVLAPANESLGPDNAPDAGAVIDGRTTDDGGTSDGPIDDAGFGPWTSGDKVMALVTTSREDDPTITADGLELIFASDRTGTLGGMDLWIATRTSPAQPFGVASRVPSVNGPANEDQPWLSPDGLTLYFSSDGFGTADVFMSTRSSRAMAWSAPVNVVELSSPAIDQVGGLTADQLAIVLASDRGGGTAPQKDLYIASRATTTDAWSTPVLVSELSTPLEEASPTFAGGGQAVYFTRDNDLYVARRAGASFGPVTRIDELSTEQRESSPHVSDDERFMFFARRDGTGTSWDVFSSSR